jgi:hypothetical protein
MTSPSRMPTSAYRGTVEAAERVAVAPGLAGRRPAVLRNHGSRKRQVSQGVSPAITARVGLPTLFLSDADA